MSHLPQTCTQVDISATSVSRAGPAAPPATPDLAETNVLLREMVTLQRRSCDLLAELLNQVSLQQRQRAAELKSWREANPELAASCRGAAEALTKVHTEFLSTIAREAADNAEGFSESDYALGDFLDRFGPRLAHFNGVMQLFAQLGAQPPADKPAG